MPVESNLVLQTSVPKPTGPGFTNVITGLKTIKKLLGEIESKSVIHIKIKVTSEVPDEFTVVQKQHRPRKTKPGPGTSQAAAGSPHHAVDEPRALVPVGRVRADKAQRLQQPATRAASGTQVIQAGGLRPVAGGPLISQEPFLDPRPRPIRLGTGNGPGLPGPQEIGPYRGSSGNLGGPGSGGAGGSGGGGGGTAAGGADDDGRKKKKKKDPYTRRRGGRAVHGDYAGRMGDPDDYEAGTGDEYKEPKTMGTNPLATPEVVPLPREDMHQVDTRRKTEGIYGVDPETGQYFLIGEETSQKQKFQKVEQGLLYTAERSIDAEGRQTVLEESAKDIHNERRVAQEKALELGKKDLAAKRKFFEDQGKALEAEGYKLVNSVSELREAIPGVKGFKEVFEKARYQKDGPPGAKEYMVAEVNEYTEKTRKKPVKVKASSESPEKFQERLENKRVLLKANKTDIEARLKEFEAQGFKEAESKLGRRKYLPSGTEKGVYKKGIYTRPILDAAGQHTGREETVSYNEWTNAMERGERVARKAKTANDALAKARHAEAQVARLQGEGWEFATQRLRRNADGTVEAITQLKKVSGNAFAGYTVQLREVSTKTGAVTERVLSASESMRYMGDSTARAIAKVALWGGATSIVFGFTSAIGLALSKVRDLEKGTILLARVGTGLTNSPDKEGNKFEHRFRQAKVLTEELVELSAAMSSDAVEAQKAAAVFARTGQTRIEILESTKAALLASRIAELDVEEAAQLLSAALSQFHLSASDLIPTLDTLNELSNNYRVTTNDLLQSISRTGSVIDQHGGRLSELAAITAVVAQTTARSGAEIGNAIKTTSSRLTSEDVAAKLFEKTGITATDAAGNARGLTDVLLELQVAFSRLKQAEQDELTIAIAGVRQRNILIAAIEQAVTAAVAEAKALSKSGSALEESQDNAITLDAAMRNLLGSFIQIAHDMEGAVLPALKSMIYLLQLTTDALSFGNSTPVKILAFTAAFYTLKTVVGLLTPGFNNLKQSLLDNIAASQYMLRVQGQNASSARALGDALLSAGKSAGIATLSFLKANWALLAITAVIAVATKVLSSYSELNAQVAQNEKDAATGHARAAAAARKRTDAVNVLNKALLAQVSIAGVLRGKEDKPSQEQYKEALDNITDIVEQARRMEITIPVNFDVTNPEDIKKLQDELARAERQAAEKEVAKAQAELTSIQNQQAKAVREAQAELDKYKGIQEGVANNTYGGALPDKSTWDAVMNGMWTEERMQQRIKASEGKVANAGNDLQDDRDAAYKRYMEAKENLDFIGEDPSMAESMREAVTSFDAADKALERLKKTASIRGNIFDSIKATDLERSNKEFSLMNNEVDELWAMYNKIVQTNPNAPREKLLKMKEAAKEATDELKGVYSQLQKIKATSQINRIRESFGIESSLTNAGSRAALLRKRRQDDEADIDLSIDTTANDDLAVMLNDRRRLLVEIASLSKKGSGANAEESVAARAEVQDRLNTLVQKEVEIANLLLEKEDAIALARKRSADEAQRALGLLSEEDKARTLIQADYFNKNPNVKVSVEQQLAGSSESNRITQEQFRDRLENYDEAKRRGAPLMGLLSTIKTEDMLQAEREQRDLNNMTGGVGAAKFAVGARQRAEQAANQRNRLTGDWEMDINEATQERLGSPTAFNVNVDMSAVDLQPLLDSFSSVAVAHMNAMQEKFIAELARIESDLKKTAARPARTPIAPGV